MKDFMKKKMYLILLVVSFSTLFSAILYADPIYCEKDSDCPLGMICVIPGNFCMEPATITCNEHYEYYTFLLCYKINDDWIQGSSDPAFRWCIWTGSQLDVCVDYEY